MKSDKNKRQQNMKQTVNICQQLQNSLLLLLAALALPLTANAATINASSCSNTDITTALSAASEGDTIQVPTGTCSWSSQVSVTKGVTILGYGTMRSLGSAGSTVIIGQGFKLNLTTNQRARIANFTFQGAPATNSAMVYISGTSKLPNGGIRIDHNTFDKVNGKAVRFAGYTYGVVDHNNGTTTGQFAHVAESINGGNDSWARGANLGSADAVYFEDNTLSCNATDKQWMLCDADDGGRVVVRNNTLSNHYAGGHDASSVNRGLVQYEVYNNSITSTFTYGQEMISMRGGTGVVFNNDLIATSNSPLVSDTGYSGINFMNYRDTSGGSLNGLWSNVGRCTGTATKACVGPGAKWSDSACTSDANCGGAAGSCIQIDGSSAAGYPCRDQIGVADDSLTIKPWLMWNNKMKSSNGAWTNATAYVRPWNTPAHIIINRDYCENSTTMPAACNGVPSTYTPYAYPHPMVSTSTTAVKLPAPTMKTQ